MWRIDSERLLSAALVAGCCALAAAAGFSPAAGAPAAREGDGELAEAGALEVSLAGVEGSEGVVLVALYDSEESFEDSAEPLRSARLAPDGELIWRLEGVAFGSYAVKAYHDLDGDGELDRGAFGRPTEPYGFSNGARGRFGPPSFEAARFEHHADTTEIEIELR